MRSTKSGAFTLALLLMVILAISISSCGDDESEDDRLGVIVTLLPQAEFVENIGGEKVDVTVMVPPGASPHTYELIPSQMKKVAKAKVYFKVGSGVDFELSWLDKITSQNKQMPVVDCSKGIDLIEMVGEDEHEDGNENHGDGMDPHIWMSPLNATIMVENICEGLIKVDPENKAYYQANRDAYLEKLTQLDQEIRDRLSQVTKRIFMVDHPAFGYFAAEYNLTMLPIEEEGKEPTGAGLVHLIDQAKEHDIKVLFVSPQFNPKSAEVIASEIDGSVIFIDSLARDYITNIRNLVDELAKAMI